MRTERDANAELARAHLHLVKRTEVMDQSAKSMPKRPKPWGLDDPAYRQGRNKWRNPQRDLDIVLTLFGVLAGPMLVILGVWLIAEIVVRWPK